MRHLMSPLDLSVDELNTLLDLASDIEKHPDKYAHVCDDKRLATLFYEPSTRTRLSFEAAMMTLAVKFLVFHQLIPVPLQRVKVLPIQSALYPVTLTSVLCATRKKVLR